MTIHVYYQGERLPRIEHIEADAGETLASLRARLVAQHGLEPNTHLFAEDGEEPLDLEASVSSIAGKAGGKVHLHRCRRVNVGVSFNGRTLNRDVGPGTTVARVKRWAAEQLSMTPDQAGEHVLQLSGTTERPAPGTHIGTLACCPACQVSFDLVPDERVNGGFAAGILS